MASHNRLGRGRSVPGSTILVALKGFADLVSLSSPLCVPEHGSPSGRIGTESPPYCFSALPDSLGHDPPLGIEGVGGVAGNGWNLGRIE